MSVLLLAGSLVSAFPVRRGCGGLVCGSARVIEAFNCPTSVSFEKMKIGRQQGSKQERQNNEHKVTTYTKIPQKLDLGTAITDQF